MNDGCGSGGRLVEEISVGVDKLKNRARAVLGAVVWLALRLALGLASVAEVVDPLVAASGGWALLFELSRAVLWLLLEGRHGDTCSSGRSDQASAWPR
jgi:hypothetical protein